MRESNKGLFTIITSALLALIGLFLFLGGAELLFLGGSWFYILAGAVLLAIAISGFKNPKLAARLYAALLLVATVWSLFEVGFNIWGLEVRLMTLIGLGVWLLLPWVWRTGQNWLTDKREVLGSVVVSCLVVLASCFSS